MTTLSVSPSFPVFTDRDGSPLENGYIWIGTAALAPIANPISVYWDAARTQLAAQPIRTLNGYPSNAGTPARLYVGSDYSMLVQDAKGTLVYSSPNATERWSGVVVDITAAEIDFLQAGAGADPRTVESKLRDVVSVKDFGAVGDGIADDTQPIAEAITYVNSLTNGGTVYFPTGIYSTLEINATLIGTGFNKTVRLLGNGRFNSMIRPRGVYPVVLNMMGSNNMILQDLHIDSSVYTSQCAIFLARTTVSTNCNNNKFINVFITGSYAIAAVVSNGSESSNWINCRIENTYTTANNRCLWTGGGSGLTALQNVSPINGGTVLDTNNPNTDNKMFGVEFYAPYNDASPVRFSIASSYSFFGCTIIAGSVNNARLVRYNGPTGGRFNGPISWYGCHFEVFGTGNVVHYLDGGGATIIYDGINNYGGYYVVSDNTNIIDYDRTDVDEQPILQSSTWTTPTLPPNSSGTKAYVYGLYSCSFSLKPNPTDGSLYMPGFMSGGTVVDVVNFYAGSTRYVGSIHNSVATALPTTGTFTVGETIQRETPVVGQPIGWKCTVSGTLGTLNGGATTGNITSGSNILTVNTSTGLAEGQRIDIAGSSAGPYYIRKLSGTTAYLDANAGATVTGAAVSFSNATLVALANL